MPLVSVELVLETQHVKHVHLASLASPNLIKLRVRPFDRLDTMRMQLQARVINETTLVSTAQAQMQLHVNETLLVPCVIIVQVHPIEECVRQVIICKMLPVRIILELLTVQMDGYQT